MIRAAFLSLLLGAAAAPLPAQEDVSLAPGATLRAMDKINAETQDFDLIAGGLARMGNLEITLRECRFPEGNPAGDAYAYLDIVETGRGEGDSTIFSGWMIASSPALNALDHFRYDVWVLRCNTL
ncbi:DUF2155 domain-containing protein [Pseudooceanicola aestuarii]|uniref:DUF2155 domain-containing protein n=1 Tax=Pseudooceanicola aestuarii TaxID=2697319 RepID=UPI0013D6F104|nr:DUF2155 domain-containing protein [Pseudooceanicola aestuarii]